VSGNVLNQVLGLQPAGDCSYRRHCGPLSTPEEVLGAGDGAAGEQYEIIHADLKGRGEGGDVRKRLNGGEDEWRSIN
jgi:hypothetical protein